MELVVLHPLCDPLQGAEQEERHKLKCLHNKQQGRAHYTDFSIFQWLLVLRWREVPSTRSRAPPPSTARRPVPAVATLVAYSNQAEHTSGVKVGTRRGGGRNDTCWRWGEEGHVGGGVRRYMWEVV